MKMNVPTKRTFALILSLFAIANRQAWAAEPQKDSVAAVTETRHSRLSRRSDKLKESSWIKLALSLTGESPEIERVAKKQLKALPDLQNILRQELHGEYAALALDVISTLELGEFFDELLAMVKKDEDGFITQTLNMLLNEKNTPRLIAPYVSWLSSDEVNAQLSGPAKLSMIDTLTRLQVEFSRNLYEQLLSDPFYDVRLMSLRHLRLALLKRADSRGLKSLKFALGQNPAELRLASLEVIAQLRGPAKDEAKVFLKSCVEDPSVEVRTQCLIAREAKNAGANSDSKETSPAPKEKSSP